MQYINVHIREVHKINTFSMKVCKTDLGGLATKHSIPYTKEQFYHFCCTAHHYGLRHWENNATKQYKTEYSAS